MTSTLKSISAFFILLLCSGALPAWASHPYQGQWVGSMTRDVKWIDTSGILGAENMSPDLYDVKLSVSEAGTTEVLWKYNYHKSYYPPMPASITASGHLEIDCSHSPITADEYNNPKRLVFDLHSQGNEITAKFSSEVGSEGNRQTGTWTIRLTRTSGVGSAGPSPQATSPAKPSPPIVSATKPSPPIVFATKPKPAPTPGCRIFGIVWDGLHYQAIAGALVQEIPRATKQGVPRAPASARTDRTGRYVMKVPAGKVELVCTAGKEKIREWTTALRSRPVLVAFETREYHQYLSAGQQRVLPNDRPLISMDADNAFYPVREQTGNDQRGQTTVLVQGSVMGPWDEETTAGRILLLQNDVTFDRALAGIDRSVTLTDVDGRYYTRVTLKPGPNLITVACQRKGAKPSDSVYSLSVVVQGPMTPVNEK